jgi:hypothetical protein
MSAPEPPEPPDVERLRAALKALGDEPGWPDADAARLFDALHGDLSADERRAAVDELIRNPQAAAAWQLAREMPPDASAGPVAVPSSGIRITRWRGWLAAAAVLLLAAGVGSQLPRLWRPAEVPVYRSADPRTIASRLPPDAPLRRAEPVLRWTGLEGARYRVRILTSDLDVLAEVDDVQAPEYRLSADVLARIPPGARILWQVEARVAGTAAVVSPTFSAQVE